MHPVISRLLIAALVIGLSPLLSPAADAAVPSTMAVYGTLAAQGGAAAPNGKYGLAFALYEAKSGGSAIWKEALIPLQVTGGHFQHVLGQSSPLKAPMLAAAKELWLGVTVNFDPEQTRVHLHAVAFSLHATTAAGLACSGCVSTDHLANGAISADKVGFTFAASKTKGGAAETALDLKCTGCVGVAEMKFDGDVDLGGNGLKAKKIIAVQVSGQTISANSFVGDGSKLTGIKTPAGSCAVKGQVVKGISPDGSLICVAGGGAGGLPPDGIDEISNNLIFNQFVDSASSKAPVPIPDNNPIGISDFILFPDVGLAQKLTVHIDLENSNLASVELTLYDPNNAKYLLLAKGAGKGTSLKTSYPDPSKPASGDLTSWIGKNPKGKWQLKVTDEAFKNNQYDGALKSWRIDIQTLSSKKIQVKGDLIVDGSVMGSKGFKIVGDTTFSGKVSFDDAVVFKKGVVFEGGVSFGNNPQQSFELCPDDNKEGACYLHLFPARPFIQASQLCASHKADICTDSQSYRMRQYYSWHTAQPNWTNSFADNDGNKWSNCNGGSGDNHSEGSHYLVPCCNNITPTTKGEQVIGGVRVLKINNSNNANWDTAVKACLALKADLCDKGQYLVLRQKGKISAKMWSSDHSDNDGNQAASAIGSTSDDTNPSQKYGYACCATSRTTNECPKGATDIQGVCVAKIHNGGTNWSTSANACAALGARLCSISQTAVLRQAGKVTSSSSWTASYSDNDGSHAKVGVGNAGDNHGTGSSYGYACCF